MDKRKSRQSFNIVAKKTSEGYNIVRYTNGFSREPVILFKNIKTKDEVFNKIGRAINIISKIVSNYGVLIQPSDKSQMVEIAMVIEDSGISKNDIRVQKNGVIYFLSEGDSDSSVRANVEDILAEANIPFNEDTVTVTRPDLFPEDKDNKDGNKEALEYTKDDTVYLQTEPEKIDTSITSEEEDEDLKKEAENIVLKYSSKINEGLNKRIEELIRKGARFKDLDSLLSSLVEEGYSVEDVALLSSDYVSELLK